MKNTKIIFILALLAIGFSSCSKYSHRIKGTGPVVEQYYELPPISAVALGIDADVYLTYGETQEVRIEGQQNIINNIEKYVDADGMWRIGYFDSVKNHAGIWIHITTPDINYATVSGSGSIETTNIFPDTSAMVYMNISGSGSINLTVNAHIMQSEISGSGKIIVNGSAHEHTINISGSGDVRAFGLNTDNTYVKISGSGSSEVLVQSFLSVIISGSGNVYYLGYPNINSNISGSGSVINRN